MEIVQTTGEKNAPKRKREFLSDDSDEDSRQTESHRLLLAKSLQTDLVQYLTNNSGSRMGTKEHFNFITEKVNQLINIIQHQEWFHHSIKTMDEKLEKILQHKPPTPPTFASVVSGGLKARPAKKEIIIIEPVNDQQDAETTKKIWKKKWVLWPLRLAWKVYVKSRREALYINKL